MSTQSCDNSYRIGDGQASALFVAGTKRIEWLSSWRDTRAYEADNKYAPIQVLMSSLRSVAGNRVQPQNTAFAATAPIYEDLDPDDYSRKCRHRHRNKYCYLLHPELAYKKSSQSVTD